MRVIAASSAGLFGLKIGAPASKPARRSVVLDIGDEGLLLAAEAFDAEFDDITGLEEARRLHAKADARRRAGGDDVARMQ
ncbi:hypothetical protein D3C80_2130110 [compost metagenome]